MGAVKCVQGATIPTFTYGIQIGWLSPNGPLLTSSASPARAPLTADAISWVAAALPLSAILGVPLFSYSLDRFGRKRCVIALSLLFSISWTIKLLAVDPTGLINARIVAGLASGGCFIVTPTYIKEISEDSRRGTLSSLAMTVCKMGVIVVYGLGMCASYYTNQAVFLAVCLTHAALFTVMPESPAYLLKIGREQEAATAIAWLRHCHNTECEVVQSEMTRLRLEENTCKGMPRVTFRSVLNDRVNLRAAVMALILNGIQTMSGCFAVINHAAGVLQRSGVGWSPHALALLMATVQLAGSMFTTATVEKFGRKIPLACSTILVALCTGTLGFVFAFHSPGWLPATALVLCIFSYGAGLAPLPIVIMAEVFSYQVRAKLTGLCMAFSFFCSSVTLLFYSPVASAFGEHVVFFVFSAMTLMGALYVILFVPETKGKSLCEIQRYWE
ncbi:Facilitated trehalose transporter Tret1-2 homolog [Eumeta japonica]|uniref:Facilitated trehalose transporter Tret1-2 homolog n=1 Tax=Eumeta variegata TaxID=151549 RepID=A0A4C1V6V8_EUMVA|nr:Facilitated trehalose transporter Tret1-2 homolog [Eumeta japonica]